MGSFLSFFKNNNDSYNEIKDIILQTIIYHYSDLNHWENDIVIHIDLYNIYIIETISKEMNQAKIFSSFINYEQKLLKLKLKSNYTMKNIFQNQINQNEINQKEKLYHLLFQSNK